MQEEQESVLNSRIMVCICYLNWLVYVLQRLPFAEQDGSAPTTTAMSWIQNISTLNYYFCAFTSLHRCLTSKFSRIKIPLDEEKVIYIKLIEVKDRAPEESI